MLVHPMPDPIAFTIPLGYLAWPVHWYGLMYLFAFIQFLLLGHLRLKQAHIHQAGWAMQHLDNILFYGVFGVILGGRLGIVLFYEPHFYFSNPAEIFKIWKGGMSFHGGFLGVIIAMLVWSYQYKKSIVQVFDLIAPLVPLGYALGRIGNFINAELPGRIASADLPWAMIWPNVDNLPRHPSPIYQALVDGVLLFIVLWIYSRKPRPPLAVAGLFALGYGLARFCTEYFRIPHYEVHWLGITLSAGQLLSVPMIVLGTLMLCWAYSLHKKINLVFWNSHG